MRPTLLAGLLFLFAVAILAVGLACSRPPRTRGRDTAARPSVPPPIEGRAFRRGGRP